MIKAGELIAVVPWVETQSPWQTMSGTGFLALACFFLLIFYFIAMAMIPGRRKE